MWAKVAFKHPSVRRFKTAVSLNGNLLTQELTGTQRKSTHGLGCTAKEYTDLVRDAEDDDFLEGLQADASEMVHTGIEVLDVQIEGARKLPIGETDDAEYTYTPNCGTNTRSIQYYG